MVSIVMTYYNRKNQLLMTLKSIALSLYKEIEVIIVDDASDDSQRIKDMVNKFPFNIRLIEINKINKTWLNPCVPFNMGLKEAKGDVVIIQNSECIHYGDIVSYSVNHIKDDDYIAFSCYSVNSKTTDKIKEVGMGELDKILIPLSETRVDRRVKDSNRWYNHPSLRPCAFHFTSAITQKTLQKVGFFDERFADGFCYDDDEFVSRVRHKGVNIIIPHPSENVFSVHQWHQGGTAALKRVYAVQKEKNRKLMLRINSEER